MKAAIQIGFALDSETKEIMLNSTVEVDSKIVADATRVIDANQQENIDEIFTEYFQRAKNVLKAYGNTFGS